MYAKITILYAVTLGALMTSAASIHGRQAAGTQFITGPCASDAECASGCCGFTSGKCAAEFVANERGEGCGFGDAQSNSGSGAGVQAGAAPAAAAPANNAGAAAAAPATPAGTQFITGPCTGDVDCASGCCGFNSGKCAAVIPALERGEGCGFGGTNNEGPGTPGNPSGAPAAAGAANNAAAPAADEEEEVVEEEEDVAAAPAAAGSGKPPGTQFITGPCANDAECASGCCGFNSGKCAAVIPALERGEGCGFGNAQNNEGPGTPGNDARRRRSTYNFF